MSPVLEKENLRSIPRAHKRRLGNYKSTLHGSGGSFVVDVRGEVLYKGDPSSLPTRLRRQVAGSDYFHYILPKPKPSRRETIHVQRHNQLVGDNTKSSREPKLARRHSRGRKSRR